MTTHTWLGSNSNSTWDNAAAWSPSGTPGASDNAIIASGAISGAIVANVDSIDDLTVDSGTSLEINGELSVLGSIDNGGGVGAGVINLEKNGELNFDGAGTISNVDIEISSGSLEAFAQGGIVTFAANTTLHFIVGMKDVAGLFVTGEVINSGTILVAPVGAANIYSFDESSIPSAFVNRGSIILAADGPNPFQLGGNIINDGAIAVGVGATLELAPIAGSIVDTGAISGGGTLLIESGATSLGIGAELTVANVRELLGADLSINGNIGYAGAFNQALLSTIDIAVQQALTLTGTSQIGGVVTGAGTLALAGGQTSVAYGAEFQQGGWTISGSTTVVTLNESVNYAGGFSEAAGATLTLAGPIALTLRGSADFADATVNGSQPLFTSGATAVSGLTIGESTLWGNSGTATENGGAVTIGDASGGAAILYNIAGGIYDIADDSGIALGASAAHVNNAGLFEKTGGSGISAIAANVGNSATAAATSGTLDFQAALWGSGKAEASNGATLEVDGDVGAKQSLVFSGAGTIALHDLDVAGVKLFHGTISGFGVGDSLDVGTAFGAGTVPMFWENPSLAFGYLTLTNGSLSATIKMIGDYVTANFTPSVNASGATVLTFQA